MATKKPAAKKPTAKKPATKKAKPVDDVSTEPRKFVVTIGVGGRRAGIIVEVPPGEDADEVCEGEYQVLLSNEVDGGWHEATEDDLKRYG